MSTDPINGLLWSFGGLILGFLIGYVTRGITSRRGGPGTTRRTIKPWAAAFDKIGRPLLGVALLALVALTFLQQTDSSRRLAELGQCEAAANRQFQTALAQRAQANHDSNAAQRTFLAVEFDPASTTADKAAAGQAYLAALAKLDDAQQANPLQVRDCGGG